jgi:hypothetical protein
VTTQSPAWRFTGLHWESTHPVLTACPLPGNSGDRPGPEARRPAEPGRLIAWILSEPRACTGVWTGDDRRSCPATAILPSDTTDAQCPACARADRGRQIARDRAPDDGREYVLYLAWFGPGLIKIGLTAADRGRDRLLEQGAITFTRLAVGPYGAVRQAEQAASAAGLAAERISTRSKTAAWPRLPSARERAESLAAARDRLIDQVSWPYQARLISDGVCDQAQDFGLTGQVPSCWQEVTAMRDGAILAGQIRFVVGRYVLLDTGAGPLLCDMRRAAGRIIRLASSTGPVPVPAGLALVDGPTLGGRDDGQQPLF